MKKTATYIFCLLLVFMPMASCKGPLNMQKGNALIVEIEAQVKDKTISKELGAALVKQIEDRMDPKNAGGLDWETILYSLGGLGSAVVASITGVRITRGPAKPMDQSQASLLRDLMKEYEAKQAADAKVARPPTQPL